MNARHATLWSVTHPFFRNYIMYPPVHNKIRKKSKRSFSIQFFSALVEREREKNDTVLPNTGRRVVLGHRPRWHRCTKKLTRTTRLIEMRITRKNGTNRRGRTGNERAARDVLLIGLCTLSLRAPRLCEKDERDEREREKGNGKEGLDCVPVSRIFRGTYDPYT